MTSSDTTSSDTTSSDTTSSDTTSSGREAVAQTCFPLIGAQGVDTAAALPYHGRWRVLDDAGRALSGGDPGLVDVSVELRFGYMVLRAPGMLRLDIPLDVLEDDPSVLETVTLHGVAVRVADEGAWAHAWFSEVLGRPARLVKLCEGAAPAD